MNSQDSSAPPHYHHHHHPQPPLPSHHVGPHSQSQQQHMPANNTYPFPNNNQHHHHFPFNPIAAAQNPPDHHYSDGSPPAAEGGGGMSSDQTKKKRGRPRKYSPDNSIGLGLSSMVAHTDSSGGGTPSDTPAKRHRGRPPGSVKKQMDALGAPGVGFTPHVIIVQTGEDIASKIMAFSQQGPRTVCILSANGAVSNVTLRQPATSSGTLTYEGRFEIISLSGSFLSSESNGSSSRSGGLSVSLAGSDGRVLGGGVAGILKAASPVQVVVGSFIADGKKSKSSNMLNLSGPLTGGNSPPPPGGSSESGEENDDSPAPPPYTNSGQSNPSMPMYPNMGSWAHSMNMHPN